MTEHERMSVADCMMVKQQITLFAQLLIPLPLQEFVNQANYEESIGPVLDPTQFRKNMEQLSLIKRLAQAALVYQKAVKEILPPEMLQEIIAAWEEKVEGNAKFNAPGGEG